MPTQTEPAATLLRFEDIDWVDEQALGTAPAELVQQAQESGARRKRIVEGQLNFFMNYSELPPAFEIPPHTHSHDELIVVLEGGCTVSDGRTMQARDTIVIRGGYEYGFVCGAEGMTFLTIRTGEATTDVGTEDGPAA